MQAYSFYSPGEEYSVYSPHLTERSRYMRGLQCSRARYLEYEAGPQGRGFTSKHTYDDLALGSAVHDGMETAMLAAKTLIDNNLEIDFPTLAEIAANKAFDSFMISSHLGAVVMGGMPYLYELQPELWEELRLEQAYLAKHLVAAGVMSWLLPTLESYEILETEREISWELDDGIVMMSRPDAVLRSKRTGRRYVVSYKTTKQFYQDDVAKLYSDIQALTEMAAVYSATGEQPDGCLYVYFIKGQRKKKEREDGATLPHYSSPLVRPYWSGPDAVSENFRMFYETIDPGTGRRSRLGKDWQQIPFWQEVPVEDWFQWLIDGTFASEAMGGDFLDLFIAAPEPTIRPWSQVERMVRQVEAAEDQRREDLARRTEGNRPLIDLTPRTEEEEQFLDLYFPHNNAGCYLYNRPCPWHDVCWGTDTLRARFATGNIVVRTPNHGQEEEDGLPI